MVVTKFFQVLKFIFYRTMQSISTLITHASYTQNPKDHLNNRLHIYICTITEVIFFFCLVEITEVTVIQNTFKILLYIQHRILKILFMPDIIW